MPGNTMLSDTDREMLLKALQAPARPNRPLADEGRHKQVRALIVRIQINGQAHTRTRS